MLGDRKKLREALAKASESEARLAATEAALGASYDERDRLRAANEAAAETIRLTCEQFEKAIPEINALEGADRRDRDSRDALAESMNLSGACVRAISAIDFLAVDPEVRGLLDAASSIARRAEDVAATALTIKADEKVDLTFSFRENGSAA